MLMITGFLGAGKTTLLRDLLDQLAEREHLADVILNDRENAYIDKATLEDHAANIAALTGSCVCCEAFHDLVDMILKASESDHDVLLIELNGTADPVPLQESLTLLESKLCLRPRWQVCVIDARHFRKRKRFNDLEILQLETASHYYISWDSELSEASLEQLEEDIRSVNSNASRTTPELLADALIGSIANNRKFTVSSQVQLKNQKPLPVFDISPPVTEKINDRHQIAHEFTGCQITVPAPVNEACVIEWLEKLPDSVIRAKALLMLKGDTDYRYLYERVGKVISPKPITTRAKGKASYSGLFIGPDIDPKEILRVSKKYLHSDCHFPE